MAEERVPSISEMDYFTNRSLENKAGEIKGRVLMFRIKGEREFHVDLKCAECGEVQTFLEVFEKRPYRVKCQKCGNSFVIEKLNKKAKE